MPKRAPRSCRSRWRRETKQRAARASSPSVTTLRRDYTIGRKERRFFSRRTRLMARVLSGSEPGGRAQSIQRHTPAGHCREFSASAHSRACPFVSRRLMAPIAQHFAIITSRSRERTKQWPYFFVESQEERFLSDHQNVMRVSRRRRGSAVVDVLRCPGK